MIKDAKELGFVSCNILRMEGQPKCRTASRYPQTHCSMISSGSLEKALLLITAGWPSGFLISLEGYGPAVAAILAFCNIVSAQHRSGWFGSICRHMEA